MFSHVILIVFAEIWLVQKARLEFGTVWFKFTVLQNVAELVNNRKSIGIFVSTKLRASKRAILKQYQLPNAVSLSVKGKPVEN